uniref:Uncharacterized protein n=1 Tax=Anguilla anguilla TaxID=7936 RepID=A0A0E9SSV6_ANGAN
MLTHINARIYCFPFKTIEINPQQVALLLEFGQGASVQTTEIPFFYLKL